MLLYIVIIGILFFIVIWNNKRNQNKLYRRKGRNFRENFQEKKKALLDTQSSEKEKEQ